MSIEAPKDDNKIYCKSIAKSISNIIRFSLDEEFRKSCFELVDVSSTKDAEREVFRRLMLIIESEKKIPQSGLDKPKKRRKNLLHKKDKKNKEFKDVLEKNEANSSSSTGKDKTQMFFQNFNIENEPPISIQLHRDVIKRRNLNYFSQPEFSQSNQKDFEHSKGNFKYSHSQPSTSTFHTMFYEANNSSSEVPDDGINYCQKMFTDSFKNNAQKYFKKNLSAYLKKNKHINV